MMVSFKSLTHSHPILTIINNFSSDIVTIGFDQNYYFVFENRSELILPITLVEDIALPVSVEIQIHSNTATENQGTLIIVCLHALFYNNIR